MANPSAAFISHRVVVKQKESKSLFQDGRGEGLSAASAATDQGASSAQVIIPNSGGITVNTAMTTNPLYIIRYGAIVNDSKIAHSGNTTDFWSSSAADTNSAFGLNFNGAALWPSFILGRSSGTPLRCLHQS